MPPVGRTPGEASSRRCKLNREDVAATRIVALIDELFAIDARAREEQLDHAARHALRQQYAPPLLEEIRQEIEQCQA